MVLEVSPQKLAEVLLDFGLAPGNFPVRLGEPHELYSQLNTVALWALGRIPDDIDVDAAELIDAARLFVRRACFAADNTHYQVMALTPKAFSPEELRTRYRSLIRLTHPDRGVPGLPGNAAGIVNRAHAILSDPLLRSQYDDHLAERPVAAKPARGDVPTMRRIEHGIDLGDRWHSMKARYPKLLRLVLSIGGVSSIAIGLLLWAANDPQEGRMLIAGSGPEQRGDVQHAARGSGPKRDDSNMPAPAGGQPARADGPPRTEAASPSSAGPASIAAAPVREAPPNQPAPSMERSAAAGSSSAASIATTQVAAAPPTPSKTSAAFSESTENKTPAPAVPAKTVVEPPGEPAVVPRSAPSTSQVAARAQTPTLPAGMIPTEQVSGAAAQPAPPAPAARRSAPSPTTVSTTTPAINPPKSAKPAPIEQRATTAPAAAALSSVEAPAAPPTGVPATRTWSVDSVRAKHFLIDLVSKLSSPSAAKAANKHLADNNVTGSLFRPALGVMDHYPEISIESMQWTDAEQPGILRVRGEIVLLARNQQGATRNVHYGLSAEFWGTRTGTVLADLNLKERE